MDKLCQFSQLVEHFDKVFDGSILHVRKSYIFPGTVPVLFSL